MAPRHSAPEDVITAWFADRAKLDQRDAHDLIAHLHSHGWRIRRSDDIAIDRREAEEIAQERSSAPKERIRDALASHDAEPAPSTTDEEIQATNARWLHPHVRQGVPAHLSSTTEEADVVVRLDDQGQIEWTPSVAGPDGSSCVFRFPVNVNTDSDTLGAIQLMGGKLQEHGHRFELVNEPAPSSGAA
jgi:hypothetical protein